MNPCEIFEKIAPSASQVVTVLEVFSKHVGLRVKLPESGPCADCGKPTNYVTCYILLPDYYDRHYHGKAEHETFLCYPPCNAKEVRGLLQTIKSAAAKLVELWETEAK